MSISKVQAVLSGGDGNPHSSRTLAYTSSVTAGDLSVVVVYAYRPSTNTFSVTDTLGTNYGNPVATQACGLNKLFVFVGQLPSSGSNTVTVNYNASGGTTEYGIALSEWLMPAGYTIAVDATGSGSGSSSGSLSTSSITLGGSADLVLAIGGVDVNGASWTIGSGYSSVSTYNGVGGNAQAFAIEYATGQSGSVSASMTSSVSGNWGAIIIGLAAVAPGTLFISPGGLTTANSVTVTITGNGTNFQAGTTFALSGPAAVGSSIGSPTIVSTTVATATLNTGGVDGNLTVTGSDGGESGTVPIATNPVVTNALVDYSGQVIVFIAESITPASNGAPQTLAVTSYSAVPTINVNGSPATVESSKRWFNSSLNMPTIFVKLAAAVQATDNVTYSAGAGWYATSAGNAPLAAGVPVTNWTGQAEGQTGNLSLLSTTPTMKLGGNYGSQPSSPYSPYPFHNNLCLRGSVWSGQSTVDSNGLPATWAANATITQSIHSSADPNLVDTNLTPLRMGTFTVTYYDPTGVLTVWLSANGHATTPVKTQQTTSNGTVTQLWTINYNGNYCDPQINLNFSSTQTSFVAPPNFQVNAPGDSPSSDPLAPSSTVVAALTYGSGANARYPSCLRFMDVTGTSGGGNNYIYAADTLPVTTATFFRQPSSVTHNIQSVRAVNTNPSNSNYAYSSSQVYFPQAFGIGGSDGNGTFLSVGATGSYLNNGTGDNGLFVQPPQSPNTADGVFELTFSSPHGFTSGYWCTLVGMTSAGVTASITSGGSALTLSGTPPALFGVGCKVKITGDSSNGTYTIASGSGTSWAISGTYGGSSNASNASLTYAVPVTFTDGNGHTSSYYPPNSLLEILVTSPTTIVMLDNVGGSGSTPNCPLYVQSNTAISVNWTLNQSIPQAGGQVNPAACFKFVAAMPGCAIWLNLPLMATDGLWQNWGQLAAQYGSSKNPIKLELGNEPWNFSYGFNPCRTLGWLAQYLPPATNLLGYTTTGSQMGGANTTGQVYAVLPILANHAMNTFTTAYQAAGGTATIERILGCQWSNATNTTAVGLAQAKNLGFRFDAIAVAPYLNIPTDSQISDAFNPSGSAWPVQCLNTIVRFWLLFNPAVASNFLAHYQAIQANYPGVKIYCYEGSIQQAIPSTLSGVGGLLADMLAHPSWYYTQLAYFLTIQAGCPTVTGAQPSLLNYYQIFNPPTTADQWSLAYGVAQAPGRGTSGQVYTTAQGNPASHNGVSNWLTNVSPGLQAFDDWQAHTGASASVTAGSRAKRWIPAYRGGLYRGRR